mgnify:CR=1 FL=1
MHKWAHGDLGIRSPRCHLEFWPCDCREAQIPVQCQQGTLMVLRHYTSGKPCLSSAFSSASDPKPQQAYPIRRPLRPDYNKRKKAYLTMFK